jgi:hypothetical protein
MTNKEIVKALECCISAESCCVCGYTKMCDGTTIHQFALDLINRQQAENERLNNELHSKVEYIHEQLEIIESKKVEIERLTNIIDDGAGVCHNCHLKYAEKIEQAKSEAIKEFADRLKADINKTWYYELENDIHNARALKRVDELVKEMVGEGK